MVSSKDSQRAATHFKAQAGKVLKFMSTYTMTQPPVTLLAALYAAIKPPSATISNKLTIVACTTPRLTIVAGAIADDVAMLIILDG